MNCDFNPPLIEIKNNNEQVLDTSNNPIYEPEYLIQYMRLDGTIIDKNIYDIELSSNLDVYICAFVGCTYHCG